ncbi:MAG: hypothetical protein JO279_15375 [Verrucomicrobia bacterium]|nr:hypothetical protein [Verrucomicrobiota bacterium]
MGEERLIILCGICGAKVGEEATICQECQRTFEPFPEVEPAFATTTLDLRKYQPRMFPWEPVATPPRLVSVQPVWLVLALGVIILVLLLALLRTPLPSCWELSS